MYTYTLSLQGQVLTSFIVLLGLQGHSGLAGGEPHFAFQNRFSSGEQKDVHVFHCRILKMQCGHLWFPNSMKVSHQARL
jgi:hypothetical protein